MHLDFPLVRNDNLFGSNVGEITLIDTSLQETEQMYIHKNTQTSSCFLKHYSEWLSIEPVFWNAHKHYSPTPNPHTLHPR